jgi:putative phosphoesterase
MIRIAVVTDAHGNLPALQAALQAIRHVGCDAIYHTGDAIAIGPHPAECLDLLLDTPGARMTMGNHDLWFAHGLPRPQPAWMSDGEVVHQQWVHAQIDPALRSVVAQWPYTIEDTIEGVRVALLHYAPDGSPGGFAPALARPGAEELDRLFEHHRADVVFYGHTHVAWDCHGRARYVNPGSLGCSKAPVARFAMLECTEGHYTLTRHAEPYDDALLARAFERRQVPERHFLYGAFFGARFDVHREGAQ